MPFVQHRATFRCPLRIRASTPPEPLGILDFERIRFPYEDLESRTAIDTSTRLSVESAFQTAGWVCNCGLEVSPFSLARNRFPWVERTREIARMRSWPEARRGSELDIFPEGRVPPDLFPTWVLLRSIGPRISGKKTVRRAEQTYLRSRAAAVTRPIDDRRYMPLADPQMAGRLIPIHTCEEDVIFIFGNRSEAARFRNMLQANSSKIFKSRYSREQIHVGSTAGEWSAGRASNSRYRQFCSSL